MTRVSEIASSLKAAGLEMGSRKPQFTTIRAFGVELELQCSGDHAEIKRQQTELEETYELFIASRAIPKTGLCADVGAGEGWFGLLFATAFPDWQVICFEADPSAYALLEQNVSKLELENVICANAAFHPDVKASTDHPRGNAELTKQLLDTLKNTQTARFSPLAALPPRLIPHSTGQNRKASRSQTVVEAPALSPTVLAALCPDFLKLDAPGAEADIASALLDVPVKFLVGSLYNYQPSNLFTPTPDAGHREYYLRCGPNSLRRDYEDNFPTRKPRLDVIVAMYNARKFILECVDSVLAGGNDAIHVIVVDDGSNDGSDEVVREHYGDNPRVRLVQKANGGCASARNFGRQCSDAMHIAFIDADDRVDPGLFTALLETARYTGSFVTQGEFSFLTVADDGKEILQPSYEATFYSQPGDHRLGTLDFVWLPGHSIAVGQPTIWRRVYRRDFLDRKKIFFPEHIRAFDDQIFQLLIAEYSGAIAHVKGHAYHYRQHPAQDIKQGDERHFYSFNMFRSLFLRSLEENWPDINPYVQSLLNTIHWSYKGLRNDLKCAYQEAAGEFLAILEKTYGYRFSSQQLNETGIDGLEILVMHHRQFMQNEPVNYGFMRLENACWQPEMLRMLQAAKSPSQSGNL